MDNSVNFIRSYWLDLRFFLLLILASYFPFPFSFCFEYYTLVFCYIIGPWFEIVLRGDRVATLKPTSEYATTTKKKITAYIRIRILKNLEILEK